MDFIFNLSFDQQIALFNLFGSVLLLSYLLSTAIILYSNYLIEKYNLEQRYPRIAVLLRYRQKFQKYYISCNILCISIVLIIMLSINFLIFFNL